MENLLNSFLAERFSLDYMNIWNNTSFRQYLESTNTIATYFRE
jgi:hypothetical protein